ncbi:MAG: aminotransferase class I/II-fold pyridoxal phosphate-dependent enzyme [Bacteroidota bacterium]
MSSLLEKAFDPATFRQNAHQLVDVLADHLQANLHQQNDAVIPWTNPEQALAFWQEDYRQSQESNPQDYFQQVLQQSINLHHPKYLGHQISPSAPIAAVSGLLADLLNNGMGVYEMGIGATAIERLIIKEVGRHFGYDEEAGGFLTSGGTLANLTALLAARIHQAKEAIWEEGTQQQLAIMVSEEAHYCVDRAVRIMGWGKKGMIKVPANERFQMDCSALEGALHEAREAGIEVIAVVGSACSTSTGSYDDLESLAQFCQQHQLWFHVDAAHGGAAIFSKQHQALLKGIEQADSIVMDFHKMLLCPALATGLFFRKESHSYQTFAQRAQYLWDQASTQEWHNLAKRTFECTKYMMGVKIYSIFRTHGTQLFEDFVDRLYGLGQQFAQLIQARPHFELAVDPECNIVCFRLIPPDFPVEALNTLNKNIRQTLIETQRFYIVQTQLKGQVYLRTTIMNPFTTEKILQSLLDEIEHIEKHVLVEQKSSES